MRLFSCRTICRSHSQCGTAKAQVYVMVKEMLLSLLVLSSVLAVLGQRRVIYEPDPECPSGKIFNECGSACPATCDNIGELIACPAVCVSGCFCPKGLVELNEGCVNPSDCPYRPTISTRPTKRPTRPTKPTTDPYKPTTDPYKPTTDPYEPTTDPYEPTTDPYQPTTDPYEPTTDPYEPYVPDEPYPTDEYPYDPYEPYDPYDPYPYYFCEMNEDEYGRPYFGPYDEYRHPGRTTYQRRPPPPPTYPPPPPTDPPYPPTTPYPPRPKGEHPTTRPPYELSKRTLDDSLYKTNLKSVTNRKKRQLSLTAATLTLPSCITSNECYQQQETCYGSGTQYDSCGRRCTCKNGYLVNCCRVRKEWRSMIQLERCRYVQVVYTASTQQPWKTCYDALIKIHRDEFGNGIHAQPFFLPWHRWYILALENLLRQIDCNITVPYWNWSLEPQTWQNSIVWAPQCGLGGDGVPPSNFVDTGEFRQTNWQLTPSANDDTGGFLRRNFNGDVPDCASVAMNQRLGIAEFDDWHIFVSSNLHDSVHCNIGGTMCSFDSANAPEFFLHHGFIDELWARWQNKGPAYKNLPYYAQNTDPMDGAYGTTPQDVYDLNNQPGCVRVCIEPSARPCRINTTYTPVCPREMNCYEYSPLKLSTLIPRPYPAVPPASHKLFRTSCEVRRISQRFTDLYNDSDELYTVLQSNGYDSSSPVSYRPPMGEIQLDRYLYRPPSYTVASSSTCETYQESVPQECRRYIPYY